MSWSVVSPETCELGESPFWHPREQCLYWVDIAGHKILRANVFMGSVEVWNTPPELGEPGCMAPAASGGFVVAMRSGLYRAQQWRGDFQRIADAPYAPAHIRFNDGKADGLGRFWASTYCEDGQPNAALYSLDARNKTPPLVAAVEVGSAKNAVGSAVGSAAGFVGGNGLAWSPDAQTIYWADTARHVVRAWDWDGDVNTLSHGRVFHQFAAKPAGWAYGQPGFDTYQGRPDGAAVDVQGNYWLAMYEGGCVKKLSPAGGVLATLPVPCLCPTMPCFGGDDLQTLYLTSARKGRSSDELAALPLSGSVFSMRVDVAGLPVNFYQD